MGNAACMSSGHAGLKLTNLLSVSCDRQHDLSDPGFFFSVFFHPSTCLSACPGDWLVVKQPYNGGASWCPAEWDQTTTDGTGELTALLWNMAVYLSIYQWLKQLCHDWTSLSLQNARNLQDFDCQVSSYLTYTRRCGRTQYKVFARK